MRREERKTSCVERETWMLGSARLDASTLVFSQRWLNVAGAQYYGRRRSAEGLSPSEPDFWTEMTCDEEGKAKEVEGYILISNQTRHFGDMQAMESLAADRCDVPGTSLARSRADRIAGRTTSHLLALTISTESFYFHCIRLGFFYKED